MIDNDGSVFQIEFFPVDLLNMTFVYLRSPAFFNGNLHFSMKFL